MGNGGKTLKSDMILNLRKGPAQVNQVNLVYHENIMNEESLPCKPSKPNIWISPVNQRAKVNLVNHVSHSNWIWIKPYISSKPSKPKDPSKLSKPSKLN